MASVFFRGEKTSMDVNAWGFHKRMLVQPGVASTDLEMGIVIWLFDEENPNKAVTSRLWGLASPHDLLTCWRGMIILQKVKSLSEDDLCNAYYAGQRKPHESDKHRIDKIVDKIGKDTYDAVMAFPIPDDVVNLIIKLTDEGDHVSLWPITEEVKAGTLQWREDFARIGAKHPQQVADREAAVKQVVERYEVHLDDYAKSQHYPRQCLIMWSIEGAIVDAIEKGIEANYGKDVALGIAIARAHSGTAALAASFIGDEALFHRSVSEAIHEAASWMASRFKTGWLVKRSKRSPQEYVDIIQQLNDDWRNMPVTHPLLPA